MKVLTNKFDLTSIITICLSFFLSLLLFLIGIVFIIHNTVFNPVYLREQLDKSHYYENVMSEVEDEFASYGNASGFDAAFFKSVVDINDVQLVVNQSVDSVYGDSDRTADTSGFKQKLYEKLLENVKSRKLSLTRDTDSRLQLLADTCASTYFQYVRIPYAENISPELKKFERPMVSLEVLFGFLAVVFVLLLFLINRWRHRAIRACIYSVSAVMLMLLVLSAAVFSSDKINRVALLSKSLHALSVSYLSGMAIMFLQVSLILAGLIILLAVLYHAVRKEAVE